MVLPVLDSIRGRGRRTTSPAVTDESREKKPGDERPAVTLVLSSQTTAPRAEETPIRCLFINWNDGTTASQFTVPDDYTLQGRSLEGERLPDRLSLLDVNAGAELWLDLSKIKSAYLIDVGPDQRVIAGALG